MSIQDTIHQLLADNDLHRAKEMCARLCQHQPHDIEAWSLLGMISSKLGDLDGARDSFRNTLELAPNNALAHYNYANACKNQSNLQEALDHYKTAIQLKPEFTQAYINIGNTMVTQGDLDQAIEHYQQAIRLDPGYISAYNNLGSALQRQVKIKESIACYRKAVLLDPSIAESHYNLGTALQDNGQFRDAIDSYRKALHCKPDHIEAHNNLGNALHLVGQITEAQRHFQQALALKPDYAEAHNNLGKTLSESGDYTGALEHYQKALTLKPDYAEAHSNLLFVLSYNVLRSPREMLEESQHWDHIQGREGKAQRFTHATSGDPNRYPLGPVPSGVHRRLRIGYVSPDFWHHAVSYFLEPILAEHDRTQVEVFCYAEVINPDAVTQRLQTLADHWCSTVGMSDEALARLIFDDHIDILIDLAGHTAGNRLKAFTYKPAPVQVTYLGYFATTGLDTMDYWITDETLHPPNTPGHTLKGTGGTGTVELATESLLRLPRCCLVYQANPEAPEVAERSGEDIVFGSFNQLTKTSPEAIALWAQVLQAMPRARLLIKTTQLADPVIRDHLLQQFAAHHIATERLILLPRTPSYREHLDTYSQVDIALDTIPRTGGATTAEALWMGVPVITLAGERFIERLSASMLNAVGLDELIAHSQQDYVAKAVALAHDPQQRAELRASLRSRMSASPLCDAKGLAHSLEIAYREMWKNHLAMTGERHYGA